MKLDILTIFPAYFAPLDISLLGKARRTGLLDIRVHDLRDWTHDRHRTVDDTPYGGGPGMVMKPEPWGEALDTLIPGSTPPSAATATPPSPPTAVPAPETPGTGQADAPSEETTPLGAPIPDTPGPARPGATARPASAPGPAEPGTAVPGGVPASAVEAQGAVPSGTAASGMGRGVTPSTGVSTSGSAETAGGVPGADAPESTAAADAGAHGEALSGGSAEAGAEAAGGGTTGVVPGSAEAAAGEGPGEDGPLLIIPTPSGRPFTQADAERYAAEPWLVFACGRYEGIDSRVVGEAGTRMRVEEVSLGDFVLAGGEVAALVMIEAIGRLVPGVLGNADSIVDDSFAPGAMESLVEGPVYTKPPVWRGRPVPDVLLSGNHGAIARWRRDEALRRTAGRRPELLARLDPDTLDERDREVLRGAGFPVDAEDMAD